MNKCKDTILYSILRPILVLIFKLLYRPIIIKNNIIPNSKKIILAGNHTNILDCILLMSCTKRHIHFLAKIELFKGIKKIIFANMGLIPVDRNKKNNGVLDIAKKYLDNDLVVGIFPEGTTEKGRGLLPFKIGAVKLSNDTNTEIIPFTITGKYRLFRKSIKIVFGESFVASNDLDKSNDILKNKIKKMKEVD